MMTFQDDDQLLDDRVEIGFAGLTADGGDRIGHYYQNEAEARALAVGFLATSLQTHTEKCVYFCEDANRESVVHELMARGIDVERAVASGQLTMSSDRPSPGELQRLLHDALADVPARFRLLRWVGDMSWSFDQMADSETMMEWAIVMHAPQAVFLCQYDLRRLSGSVVIDALKMYPLSIVGNTVHQNPYYQDPQ